MTRLDSIFEECPVRKQVRARALTLMKVLNIETVEQLRAFLEQKEYDINDLGKHVRGVGKATLNYVSQALRQAGYLPENETKTASADQRIKGFYDALELERKKLRGLEKPTDYTRGIIDGLSKYEDLLRRNGLTIAPFGSGTPSS